MAKVNYTPETVAKITEMYQELGNDGLQEIAEAVGKSVRSVRAKLVRENVYVAPEKPEPEARDEGPTKKELASDIRAILPDFDTDGLMPAKKEVIAAVLELARETQIETA